MASIRKRGNSYLLVVSMGYTPDGRRRNPQQKTVKPPTGLTPKQTEKWLQEQAMLFEMSCKKLNPDIDRSITLKSTPRSGCKPLLRTNWQSPRSCAKSRISNASNRISAATSWSICGPEHFRSLYTKLRKQKNKATRKAALRSDGRGCPQLPVRHPLRRDGGRLSRSQPGVAHLQIRRTEERKRSRTMKR